jgi:hypothetical protein
MPQPTTAWYNRATFEPPLAAIHLQTIVMAYRYGGAAEHVRSRLDLYVRYACWQALRQRSR